MMVYGGGSEHSSLSCAYVRLHHIDNVPRKVRHPSGTNAVDADLWCRSSKMGRPCAKKRGSCRKDTGEDFDIPNTAETDTEREEKEDHAQTWLSPTSLRTASINVYMYAVFFLWTLTACLFSANPCHQRPHWLTTEKVPLCQARHRDE